MNHVLCPGCERHVRVDETDCPFCDRALTAADRARLAPDTNKRLRRAAYLFFGATVAIAGCGEDVVTTTSASSNDGGSVSAGGNGSGANGANGGDNSGGGGSGADGGDAPGGGGFGGSPVPPYGIPGGFGGFGGGN